MDKIKILTVIGTRPEAIKLMPVLREISRRHHRFISRVCVTGQHRQLLDQVLSLFSITPNYDLNLMLPIQSLAELTSRAVKGIDRVLINEKPDVLLIQGDTTTAFCGALAAFYQQIRIGHIEAGLRTENKYSPFPEEINRRIISHLADYHFAPTERAKEALLKEGINADKIYVTGNTVIDALVYVQKQIAKKRPELPPGLIEFLDDKRLILVTGHRRENFGKGFENICLAIREVADMFSDIVFVYPVHLNPNVFETVNLILCGHPRILLIDPLPYPSFIWLMTRAAIVLSDSGGIQEEIPSLGKPALIMRETTERPEGMDMGNTRLVGVEKKRIVKELTTFLNADKKQPAISSRLNPYGDGKSAVRIIDILSKITAVQI